MRIAGRLGLGLLALLAGCSNGPHWDAIASQADEASLLTAAVAALLVVPGNLDPAATPEATAMAAAAAATDPFDPNECVSTTLDGATIVYALDHCAGPFQLVRASGHLSVTYRAATDGRTTFSASTSDLVINGGAASFTADAAVAHASGTRTIEATIHLSASGIRGTHVTRDGTLTARWMDSWGCLLVDDARDTTTIDARTWSATTTAVSFCIGECPMAGGAIAWTSDEGTIDLTYDGSASAAWSVAAPAESGTVALTCPM
jgi:hypothetical protein